MTRITNAQIEHYEKLLNTALNNPLKPWVDGKGQVGNIHTYSAYGYLNIHQMVNDGGGVTCLAQGLSKSGAYEWYKAACTGIDLYQKTYVPR